MSHHHDQPTPNDRLRAGGSSSAGEVSGVNRRAVLRGVTVGAAALGGLGTCGMTHAHAAEAAASANAAGPVPEDAVRLTGDGGARTRLILLGTSGGPVAAPGRTGISSVLVVGDRAYLVDAGAGAVRKYAQAGLTLPQLAGVFVTHLHSDHLGDLFNLFWLNPLTPQQSQGGTLELNVPVFGPGPAGGLPTQPAGSPTLPVLRPEQPTPGTEQLFSGLMSAYAYDINIRIAENNAPTVPATTWFRAHDIPLPAGIHSGPDVTAPAMRPFQVYEDDRVRVTAILVPHGPVYPSYAFRFETEDGAVTFSGDTRRDPNIERIAANTDILVHEVIDVDYYADLVGGAGTPMGAGIIHHMEQAHTTGEAVGRVAAAAGARHLVLSHIGPGDPRLVTDDQWRRRVRRTYRGRLTVGHDLVQMAVGGRRKN